MISHRYFYGLNLCLNDLYKHNLEFDLHLEPLYDLQMTLERNLHIINVFSSIILHHIDMQHAYAFKILQAMPCEEDLP